MKKTKSKCGYIVYRCTLTELVAVTGGYGVCDMCNTPDKEMFLVPVLNSAMCPKCYNDWNNRALYYKDDIGTTKTLSAWARENGLPYSTVQRRIDVYHWTIKNALSLPKQRKKRKLVHFA